MKIFTFLLFLSSISIAQSNINGIWADSTGSAFSNCTAIFAVENDSVYFAHYLEFNGQPFVEHGKGFTYLAKDNIQRFTYQVKVTLPIPGWSSAGIHSLELSQDGKTLRGTFIDNLGKTGPIVFKKILPQPTKK